MEEHLVKWAQNDRGSLSILSTSLFLLLVLSSFVVMNASSAFLAKRELVQIGELAASNAAHILDKNAYYASTFLNSSSVNSASPNSATSSAYAKSPLAGSWNYSGSALPIDCASAYAAFSSALSRVTLRGNPIAFTGWQCDGYALSVVISSRVQHLLALPILGSESLVPITAEIAVVNRLQTGG